MLHTRPEVRCYGDRAVTPYLLRIIALAGSAFAFGVTLKLSDLLQEHGYRWFRGAAMVCGIIAAGFAVTMLAFSHPELRLFWLAVLLSWIVRGRIDGANHGVMALAILATILVDGPAISHDLPGFFYFLIALIVLGAAHDLLQYTEMPAPRAVRWFFEHQHLYWYLLAIGWCLFFELDAPLALCIYAFVKGYGFLYSEVRRDRLRRLGIEPPIDD